MIIKFLTIEDFFLFVFAFIQIVKADKILMTKIIFSQNFITLLAL